MTSSILKFGKIVLAVSLIILLQSCSTTKGISDSSLESRQPYIFGCKGTIESAMSEVKRIVVRNGFTLQNDDLKAGILTTNPKPLDKDERFYPSFSLASYKQDESGTLFFIFTQTGNDEVSIEFFAKIMKEEKEYTGIGAEQKYTGKNREEETAEQGHPLPMKFRKLFEAAGMKRK